MVFDGVEMVLKKIYGGAGCGKTYYLNKELVRVIEDVPLQDVCMMTLTRNARKEFVERAIETTGTKDPRALKWFGTMHSTTWALTGMTKDNIIKPDAKELFQEQVGLSNENGMLKKLVSVDTARRECMQPCNKDGFTNTLRLTGGDTGYKCDGSGVWKHLHLDEFVIFGKQWGDYLESSDLFDYTRSIQYAFDMLKDRPDMLPFDKLFVDEFQDFSPLQHSLYLEMAKQVSDSWVCGDDLQVIFRFAGATPDYLLDDPCDEEIILPKTYRYGREILDNSQKYADPLTRKKDRDIEPAKHDGVVEHIRGSGWKDVVEADNSLGESTVYLARYNNSLPQIISVLDSKGVIYGYLGKDMSRIEKLISLYNSITSLHTGDLITVEAAIHLVDTLPAMQADKSQTTLFGDIGKPKRVQYLKKGVSTLVKSDTFIYYNDVSVYNAESFAETFLRSGEWDSYEAIRNIKGLEPFLISKNVSFPTPIENMIHHYVGTIHKFKGNEANNVFLFTQIGFPASKRVTESVESRDDELRTFYVGATRARNRLYEISDYLVDNRGNQLMNVSEII